jgi:hypothetical protein
MRFSTLLLAASFLLLPKHLVALPAGASGEDTTTSITEFESGTLYTTSDGFQYLELSDGFDVSHPALNIELLLSLLAENKTLPKLPGVPYDGATSFKLPKGQLKCETSGGSPYTNDVNQVADQLNKLGNAGVWCCHKKAGSMCAPLHWKGTAISDLCNWKKKHLCIKCGDAGKANKEVAGKCTNNGKAGGYVR